MDICDRLLIQLTDFENKPHIIAKIMRYMIKFAINNISNEINSEVEINDCKYKKIINVIAFRLVIFDRLYVCAHNLEERIILMRDVSTMSRILHFLLEQTMHYLETLQYISIDMLETDMLYTKMYNVYQEEKAFGFRMEICIGLFESIIGG